MRVFFLTFVLVAVVFVECEHTFMGTNVLRTLAYHNDARYHYKMFQKRVENLYFSLPPHDIISRNSIKGIMAYDLTNSDASANVTEGGIGFNHVTIRMKSARGKDIHYDIYIYT